MLVTSWSNTTFVDALARDQSWCIVKAAGCAVRDPCASRRHQAVLRRLARVARPIQVHQPAFREPVFGFFWGRGLDGDAADVGAALCHLYFIFLAAAPRTHMWLRSDRRPHALTFIKRAYVGVMVTSYSPGAI